MENARCYMLAENRHEIVKKKKKCALISAKHVTRIWHAVFLQTK